MNNPETHSPLQQEDVALVKKIDEIVSTDTANSAELMPLLLNLSGRLKAIFVNEKGTQIVKLSKGVTVDAKETSVGYSSDLITAIAILSTIVESMQPTDQLIKKSPIKELFTGVVKALNIQL